jgi:hypothetical protein
MHQSSSPFLKTKIGILKLFYTPEIEKATNENDTGPSPANTAGLYARNTSVLSIMHRDAYDKANEEPRRKQRGIRRNRPANRSKLRGINPIAIKDPSLRAEAKQQPLEINPTTGQEFEALAKDVLAQPKELVARMNKLMGK